MLHKLDGFIWLAAVSVDCYSNALQHNGLGQSLPGTLAHTFTETCSQELGNGLSNEKNSLEAGTRLTNTPSPPSHARKSTYGPFCLPLPRTHTHTYTYIFYTNPQRPLKIPVLKIAGRKWETGLRLLLLRTRPAWSHQGKGRD